jgi:hypothetical protein
VNIPKVEQSLNVKSIQKNSIFNSFLHFNEFGEVVDTAGVETPKFIINQNSKEMASVLHTT